MHREDVPGVIPYAIWAGVPAEHSGAASLIVTVIAYASWAALAADVFGPASLIAETQNTLPKQ